VGSQEGRWFWDDGREGMKEGLVSSFCCNASFLYSIALLCIVLDPTLLHLSVRLNELS
jgi:hypothetical protein